MGVSANLVGQTAKPYGNFGLFTRLVEAVRSAGARHPSVREAKETLTNVSRLPGPSAEAWDWQRHGACRSHDSGTFFHPDGERGASRLRREMTAKSICRACPVRAQCAAHALAAREPYGVWGGFTEAERSRLLAAGWEEAARARGWVDVGRLEAQLGLAPPVPAPRAPVTTPRPVATPRAPVTAQRAPVAAPPAPVTARRREPTPLVPGVSAPGR